MLISCALYGYLMSCECQQNQSVVLSVRMRSYLLNLILYEVWLEAFMKENINIQAGSFFTRVHIIK